jgi:hypothetical protein
VIPPAIQTAFLGVWIENKSIASSFESHLPVILALWKLIPRYRGNAVRLYRGEFASACQRRTYGISWTADLMIAEKFATDTRQCSAGGSCIIETMAPRKAIIGTTKAVGDYYSEKEYFVDRRGLSAVRVFRRYAQMALEEWRKNA